MNQLPEDRIFISAVWIPSEKAFRLIFPGWFPAQYYGNPFSFAEAGRGLK
jgi:hypothetical protein